MYNRFYLNDKSFLKELDESNQKIKYARIISLTNEEEPIEEIQGKVTGGSISLDGSSAVRRTCSLTIVSQDININNFYWGLNTKFKLEIGVKNIVNSKYPDIIWFPQGIYIITSFSESVQTTNHTIQISGKDKMVLLNGEVGGHITSLTWDFGTVDETQDDGSIINYDVKLKDIIQDAVHEFAKEPLSNIVVDLDASGYNLLKYNGTESIYFLFRSDSPDSIVAYNIGGEDYISYNNKLIKYNELENDGIDGKYYNAIDAEITDLNTYNFVDLAGKASKVKLVEPYYQSVAVGTEEDDYNYESNNYYYKNAKGEYVLDSNEKKTEGREYYIKLYKIKEGEEDNEYNIWKVDSGNPVGYEETDLVYAHSSDSNGLIMSVGETITAMLDKIVNQLGDYEYFYDVDGKFRFQRKKTYINSSFNNITKTIDNDIIVLDNAQSSSFTYTFEGNKLISSFQNTPDLLNLRNDYSIWGKRESSSGAELPIHIRYAIDDKPEYYKTLAGKIYCTNKKYLINKFQEELVEKAKKEVYAEKKAWFYNNSYWEENSLYKEQLEKILKKKIKNYKKEENPNGLSENWWNILDWGNYYEQLTNEYPAGTMGLYTQQGSSTNNLNEYFKIPTNEIVEKYKKIYEPYNAFSTGTYDGRAVSVFDTYSDGDNIYLAYFGHGSNCGHDFNWFIEKNNQGIITYIYCPSIPEQAIVVTGENYRYYFYQKWTQTEEAEELVQEKYKVLLEEFISNCNIVDWREIIYQMAVDYRANYYNDPSWSDLMQFMNGKDNNGDWLYPQGRTKYEQYYTDIISFWRQLYCPKNDYYPIEDGSVSKSSFPYCTKKELTSLSYKKNTYYYLKNGIFYWTGSNNYKEDRSYYLLKEGFFKKIILTEENYKSYTYYYKSEDETYYCFDGYGFFNEDLEYYVHENEYYYRIKEENNNVFTYIPAVSYDTNMTYYKYFDGKSNDDYNIDSNNNGWSLDIVETPESLNFWFDFLDSDGEMAKYSAHLIGDRTKALNDDDVKAIYFREVPKVVFGDDENLDTDQSGSAYIHFKTSEYLQNLFEITSQGKTAIDALTTNFYNYSYCTESVNISGVPIYYLEPGTRVFIHDQETGINGEYLISKITLPFEYNGNMSLSAIKAPQKLF